MLALATEPAEAAGGCSSRPLPAAQACAGARRVACSCCALPEAAHPALPAAAHTHTAVPPAGPTGAPHCRHPRMGQAGRGPAAGSGGAGRTDAAGEGQPPRGCAANPAMRRLVRFGPRMLDCAWERLRGAAALHEQGCGRGMLPTAEPATRLPACARHSGPAAQVQPLPPPGPAFQQAGRDVGGRAPRGRRRAVQVGAVPA